LMLRDRAAGAGAAAVGAASTAAGPNSVLEAILITTAHDQGARPYARPHRPGWGPDNDAPDRL